MNELRDSIQRCRVEGNTIYLPNINDTPLANYPDVKKAFLNAGAKYQRNTFVFPGPAQPIVDRLLGGENVNIKKEFQFFETPPELAKAMVKLANLKPGVVVLEPSAGQGALIKAINDFDPTVVVDYCELMKENVSIIDSRIKKKELEANFVSDDFTDLMTEYKYDRIIANPPFTKNQDIDHIYKMYSICKPGGFIVTVASNHWRYAVGKKEAEFKKWVLSLNHEIIELPAGTFKGTGTNVAACLIVIDK